MGKMDSLLLRSKFRGSMFGALMGDCLGSAYEGEELFTSGMKLVIQRSFDKLEGPHFKAPVMQFTDDSAMTFAVAESLIERGEFDQKDMAKKFVKSYYKEPNRGYGASVTTVFQKLRSNKFVDILLPAREQFNGQGSLGNGGAMRVTPIALFCYKNYELMVDVAKKQAQITHTHKTGVDGAILQAIAVHQSLLLDPKEKLDSCKFTDDLIEKMDKIEVDEEGLDLVNPSPYKTQLKLMRDLICEEGEGPHGEKVVHHLGTDISALHSVPTAIYCFLRAQKPIKDVQTENPLRRTIQYAFPCLWKQDISAYADNEARHCAYRIIHEAMNMPNVTFTDVILKIRETRRWYIKELKKALTAQAAGHIYRPKFSWFDVVHKFLYPYLEKNESADLHNINCNIAQLDYFDCKSVSKTVIHGNERSLAVEDPRHGKYCSYCEALHSQQSFCSVSGERSFPVDFSSTRDGPSPDGSCFDNSNSLYQRTAAPLSYSSSRYSPQEKYHSSPLVKMRIPRHMHSLQLPDYFSPNSGGNVHKPGVQFVSSSDSILSDKSSSTIIVCQKKSNYTCTPVKTVTECGVQWTSSDSEQFSVCCDKSVGKNTRDSAISVEYDGNDIFAKTIACYLRRMDMETALQAQNQILKVINDHRLHKPDTQSIRLLRPELISERGIVQKGPSQVDRSHDHAVAKIRSNQQPYVPRSTRDIKQTGPPKEDLSKARQLKLKASKRPTILEPVVTHHKHRIPTPILVRSSKADRSISLGGDTDTIGSMAGSIAGAFYGEDMIRPEVLRHCESSSVFKDLADQLFELTSA